MQPQLKQTIQQRLLMAPNITLALEILRMPAMELQAFLQIQSEANPLLELEETVQEDAGLSDAETNGSEEVPAAWDEEWLSHWRSADTLGRPRATPEAAEGEGREERQVAMPQTFYESLRMQLGAVSCSDEESRLADELINHLNEDGYLETPLEELASLLSIDCAQLEMALKIIQTLDPPGVGARDLRECLLLQFEAREILESQSHSATHKLTTPHSPSSIARVSRDSASVEPKGCRDKPTKIPNPVEKLAYRILRDHFELFLQRHLQAIASATGATPQEAEAAYTSLKSLNPKPGRIFSGDMPPYIVPDLVISRIERHYDVRLNDEYIPQIGVSRIYHRMLRDPATPQDAKEFLLKKFRQASWIIKAIDERNSTLLAIARCLISLQREFLAGGPKALKPLTQAQVASLIGRHPSTVSRAIAGKTIDTPYGIFHLEEFFASNIPQQTKHNQVSDAQIKSEIQHLIEEENAHTPLSDEALVKRLKNRNISVARRTVAKYRTEIKILPAHLRKNRS